MRSYWFENALSFVWDHKGALSVVTVLCTFAVRPDVFLKAATDTTSSAAESAGKSFSESVVQMANCTGGVIVLIFVVSAFTFVCMYVLRKHYMQKTTSSNKGF